MLAIEIKGIMIGKGGPIPIKKAKKGESKAIKTPDHKETNKQDKINIKLIYFGFIRNSINFAYWIYEIKGNIHFIFCLYSTCFLWKQAS